MRRRLNGNPAFSRMDSLNKTKCRDVYIRRLFASPSSTPIEGSYSDRGSNHRASDCPQVRRTIMVKRMPGHKNRTSRLEMT